MNIIEDFTKVRDKYGLTSPYPTGAVSGNGIRYTTEYIYVLKKYNQDKEEIRRAFTAVMSCEREPGMFGRTPGYSSQQGPDDYVALGHLSAMLAPKLARDILAYGRAWKNRKFYVLPYYYDNATAGSKWSGLFILQQQLIAHLQWAAGETPPLWRRVWWCGSVLVSSFSKGHDTKMLSWHLCKVAQNKGWMEKLVTKFFRKKLKDHYPQGAGGVMADYLRQKNHPLAVYLRDDY